MSERQVWISRSKKMLPVIEEALRTFPDATNDSQALTRALFHWYYGRQDNSKRGALDRIEARMATKAKQEYHEQLLLTICNELGLDVDTETIDNVQT